MIDAHLHLQDARLTAQVESVLALCQDIGIRRQHINGTRPADWPQVAALAARFPRRVVPSYGLHPWYVKEAAVDWGDTLAGFLRQGAVGVGEIGLDRWIRDHDLRQQEQAFRYQLNLAVSLGLPLTIHCLRAWGPLHEILRSEPLPPQGFLLHSYGGPAEMVKSFLDLGGYFSLSGHFLGKRKHAQLETFRERIPLDRLLLETDAPDMALPPEMVRYGAENGNHPANLAVIYERFAALIGMECRGLVEQVRENAVRLFGNALDTSREPGSRSR